MASGENLPRSEAIDTELNNCYYAKSKSEDVVGSFQKSLSAVIQHLP